MNPEYTLEQCQEEAQQLEGLVSSPGWAVVVNEANGRIQKLTEMLVDSNDAAADYGLKANIRGLKFLLSFPNEIRETARRATEAKATPIQD